MLEVHLCVPNYVVLIQISLKVTAERYLVFLFLAEANVQCYRIFKNPSSPSLKLIKLRIV